MSSCCPFPLQEAHPHQHTPVLPAPLVQTFNQPAKWIKTLRGFLLVKITLWLFSGNLPNGPISQHPSELSYTTLTLATPCFPNSVSHHPQQASSQGHHPQLHPRVGVGPSPSKCPSSYSNSKERKITGALKVLSPLLQDGLSYFSDIFIFQNCLLKTTFKLLFPSWTTRTISDSDLPKNSTRGMFCNKN